MSESQNKAEKEMVYQPRKAFSFSQVRMYDECPYKYKLAYVLDVPRKGSGSMSFGTTMHNTLQTFYERVQALNAVQQVSLFAVPAPKKEAGIKVPSLDELLAIYEKSWIADWYTSDSQREEYYEKGKAILRHFYATHEGAWTIPVNLESWFKIKIGTHLMHGRIDRIDQQPDGTLEIIDYKTGKAKETLTSEDKEQLLIYQIATEQLPEYRHVGATGKLTFYYLNDNIKTSFVGEDEEIKKLKAKLTAIIDRIHVKDFTPTPSAVVCGRCDFKDICRYRV